MKFFGEKSDEMINQIIITEIFSQIIRLFIFPNFGENILLGIDKWFFSKKFSEIIRLFIYFYFVSKYESFEAKFIFNLRPSNF